MPVIIKAAADAHALYQKVEPFIPANAAQVFFLVSDGKYV